MTLRIVQLGLGQQGAVNIKSLQSLIDEFDFEIVAVSDPVGDRIDKVSNDYDLIEGARRYSSSVGLLRDELERGVDVVLDSTPTHEHSPNIRAALDALDEGSPKPVLWAAEKTVFSGFSDLFALSGGFMRHGVKVIENNVEIYSGPKTSVLDDIALHGGEILRMDYARGGDARGKCLYSKRNLFKNFQGSFRDKNIHDVCKARETLKAAGVAPEPVEIGRVEFDLTGIIYPDGSHAYLAKDGTSVQSPSEKPINESYSYAEMEMNGVPVTLLSSFAPLKAHDRDCIESWLTPQMRSAVYEANGAYPEMIRYKDSKWHETRTERVVVQRPNGSIATYVSETFAAPFSAVQSDGDAQVLYHTPNAGEYDARKADWHTRFVRDALNSATTGSSPRIGLDDIIAEQMIMDSIERKGYESALSSGRVYNIDLRHEHELSSLWQSSPLMRV